MKGQRFPHLAAVILAGCAVIARKSLGQHVGADGEHCQEFDGCLAFVDAMAWQMGSAASRLHHVRAWNERSGVSEWDNISLRGSPIQRYLRYTTNWTEPIDMVRWFPVWDKNWSSYFSLGTLQTACMDGCLERRFAYAVTPSTKSLFQNRIVPPCICTHNMDYQWSSHYNLSREDFNTGLSYIWEEEQTADDMARLGFEHMRCNQSAPLAAFLTHYGDIRCKSAFWGPDGLLLNGKCKSKDEAWWCNRPSARAENVPASDAGVGPKIDQQGGGNILGTDEPEPEPEPENDESFSVPPPPVGPLQSLKMVLIGSMVAAAVTAVGFLLFCPPKWCGGTKNGGGPVSATLDENPMFGQVNRIFFTGAFVQILCMWPCICAGKFSTVG